MVRGHCQKQQENFESKTCISSTRRRMANCLTYNVRLPLHIYIYTSSQAGLVVPAAHSQDGKVKLFFVRDARHHSRWAHLSSALRDSCSAAAWLVWPLRALPQPFCTGLAKLTLHQLLSEVIQLCTELSTNAGGASSINNCKATRGRQENVWDGASFPPSCKLLLTKQWH